MLHVLTDRLAGEKVYQDIRSWLSPPDPWKNHNIAQESRHSGTGEWFVKGDMFSEWKDSGPSSLLWLHGKRQSPLPTTLTHSQADGFPISVFIAGAGKSVIWYVIRLMFQSWELTVSISSTIIEEIEAMRKFGRASLAIFFYDFREDQKKNLRGLLSSILAQLCCQSDSYCAILSKLYLEYDYGSRDPGNHSLVLHLKDLLGLSGQSPIFLIIDALDECPNTTALSSPREQVLVFIEDLIDSQFPNLRICITSRPEADIRTVLEPLTFRSISLHDERGQMEDIENYIKAMVNSNRKMRRWKPEHKQLVIEILTKRADGM